MEFNDDCPLSPAAVGGHLVRLVADRDGPALAQAVSQVSLIPGARTDRPKYEDVLAWLMDAIVEVVEARLGPAPPGETFVLAVRHTDGHEPDPAELPASGQWVLRAAAAFLGDAPAEAERQLAEAGRELDPLRRAETLTDTLVWLDFLLDVELPDPPDVPTSA
ncbi:hypothetical protein ACFTWF_24450 [Rhodococcus sp. NPDC056960]|uniref:hypothetical protein n=1 Tax=Rhodococcus sp. NPDC056960 TaxID=3345982 RepID=UPI003633769A